MLNTHRHITRILTLALMTLALSSCGWQLRGSAPGATSDVRIKALNIISENRNNAFFRSIQNALTRHKITETSSAELALQISKEVFDRHPMTYSRTGVPAQYQLVLHIEYQASREGEVLIPQRRITSRRNYDFDPDLIIAKDREQEELLQEMRAELAERILASVSQAI